MRWVELRRHSYTKKDSGRGRGSHLSQHGVDAARAVGTSLVNVGYVAVSDSPRSMETAIAMGFAVNDVVGIASAHVTEEVGFHEWWDWPDPWTVYAERIAGRPKLAEHVATQADIVRTAVTAIDDGETSVLVGHGGWIEPTVVALLGAGRVENWGPPFNHLEGVRLAEDGGHYTVAHIHRLT